MLRRALKQTTKYLLSRAGYEIRRIPVRSTELSGPTLSDQPRWINEIIAHVNPIR